MEQLQIIRTTPEQLVDLIDKTVSRRFEDLKQNFQPKEPTEYLTRSETAKLLKIDLSTLHNWTKKGKLIAHGIGARVYYKRSEIENAIIEL